MRRLFCSIAFVSCVMLACSKTEKKSADDELVEEIDGKAKLDGKTVKITSCKAVAGDKDAAVLELVLEGDVTVRREQATGVSVDGTKVECGSTSYSGSSGAAGSRRWVKGKLAIVCDTKKGQLDLDVTYDCGSKSHPGNLL
ncbi:MAG: hypothetical protein ABI175_04705 [Polyangiales bacterium]